MTFRVFLSHASADLQLARSLARQSSERTHVPYWMAEKHAAPGRVYAEEIAEAIDRCVVFVVLLTENSIRSNSVLRELELAAKYDRIIFPVVFGELEIPKAIEYYVANVHQHRADEDPDLIEVCDTVRSQLIGELMDARKSFPDAFADMHQLARRDEPMEIEHEHYLARWQLASKRVGLRKDGTIQLRRISLVELERADFAERLQDVRRLARSYLKHLDGDGTNSSGAETEIKLGALDLLAYYAGSFIGDFA